MMTRLWNIFFENKDLFPTKWSLFIFVAYMALFINQGLLVTASRLGDTSYPYNTTTVVLFTEIFKLILASFAYISKNSVHSLISNAYEHRKVLYYYMVPATLYCFYNNLAFTNLAIFDPTTYFMFMQTRLLMTGVIYQFLFKRKLSGKQWISLLILTVGCMIQKLNPDLLGSLYEADTNAEDKNKGILDLLGLFSLSHGLILVMIQVCCSVFAGVYNEYIIKNIAGQDVDIMLQNVYMYLDSIFCNIVMLAYNSELKASLSIYALKQMIQVFVIFIILNNSLVGIVTSLFLKNLNSILKAFASALELIFTAILSFLLLRIPLHWNTVLAVIVVSYAVVMYAQNPLKVTNNINDNAKKDEILPLTSNNNHGNVVITQK